YDIQFRLRMANDPSRSWSNDDGHLWITCSLFGTASGPPMLKPKTVGQCYDFNYKAGCLKPFCKYAHTSMVCKAVHPVVNCTRSCPQSVAPESRDVTLPNVRPQFGKRQLLDQYPNREEAEYSVNGLENGFLLGFSGPREPFECKNLKSVNGHGSIVRQKLLTEVAAGIISGPFVNKPISNLRVSHIGLVPKRTDGFRLITHMSYPYLESGCVNNKHVDSISRMQWEIFRQLAPNADTQPTPIPQAFWTYLKMNLPDCWPPSLPHFVQFVAHLSKFKKCSFSTINVYSSEISFFLKLNNLQDFYRAFII
ncbi:hypothetical protein MAR_013793, partial [Mya arenaria]